MGSLCGLLIQDRGVINASYSLERGQDRATRRVASKAATFTSSDLYSFLLPQIGRVNIMPMAAI